MLTISHIFKQQIEDSIVLPLSKSICNRVLIIEALIDILHQSEFSFKSNDNVLLLNALSINKNEYNFEDAGTPMRLFLAYACLKNKQIIINGNARLRERPIAPLVNALKALGAIIIYTEKEGFLPLSIIKGVNINAETATIDGSLSSQFVSALLLIAPYFNNGLKINITGTKQSESYINTTIEVMKNYGAIIYKNENTINIEPKKYNTASKNLMVADWSSATFIYNIVAIAKNAQIFLPNLYLNNLQADEYTADLYLKFGVDTIQQDNGILLKKTANYVNEIKVDFTNCPDMFPSVVVCCAALKIKGKFTGIENLRLKESDRIKAMQENLKQIGTFFEESKNKIDLYFKAVDTENYSFKSFNDHRIAMACSIFAFYKPISIDDEKVVSKSFADYWEIFKQLTQ